MRVLVKIDSMGSDDMSLWKKRAFLGLILSLFHLYFWIFVAYHFNFSINITCFLASLFLRPILDSLDKRLGRK